MDGWCLWKVHLWHNMHVRSRISCFWNVSFTKSLTERHCRQSNQWLWLEPDTHGTCVYCMMGHVYVVWWNMWVLRVWICGCFVMGRVHLLCDWTCVCCLMERVCVCVCCVLVHACVVWWNMCVLRDGPCVRCVTAHVCVAWWHMCVLRDGMEERWSAHLNRDSPMPPSRCHGH